MAKTISPYKLNKIICSVLRHVGQFWQEEVSLGILKKGGKKHTASTFDTYKRLVGIFIWLGCKHQTGLEHVFQQVSAWGQM